MQEAPAGPIAAGQLRPLFAVHAGLGLNSGFDSRRTTILINCGCSSSVKSSAPSGVQLGGAE